MSSASLAVAVRPHLDNARVAAISTAIALNLAVLIIASRPIAPEQLSVVRQLAPVPLIRLIEPPAKAPPPAPVVLKPLPHPPPVPHTRVMPKPIVVPPIAPPDTQGNIAAPPVTTPPAAATPAADPSTGAAPVEASLAYRSAPLQFPIQALRERMHGTVLLRVLVDERGRPLEVTVERGSGHALLDRSAREQVLATWRFQPAMVDGRPVRAWARVPVSFNLSEQ